MSTDIVVATRTTTRTTTETTRISADGTRTVTRAVRVVSSVSLDPAKRPTVELAESDQLSHAPSPNLSVEDDQNHAHGMLSATLSLSAIPNTEYSAVRSEPTPLPTCARISNLNHAELFKEEFHLISRAMDPSDDDDGGEFIANLTAYLETKTIVTISQEYRCSLASQFAQSLAHIRTRVESMSESHVAAPLYARYIGFVIRVLDNCDCFSYHAIRSCILTDGLGVVLPMLFATDSTSSEHMAGAVLFKSVQKLLVAASRPENLHAHVDAYSRLSCSHVWGCRGQLVVDGEEAVQLVWPEGGRRAVSLRLLQKGGRATEAFRNWRATSFPNSAPFTGEAWLDALEVNQADQTFKGRQVGLMWQNYENAFVLFVPTKTAKTAQDVFQSLADEQPWSRAWVRQELVLSAEFAVSVPGFEAPLPIEVVGALALLEPEPVLTRADYWMLCVPRYFAFTSPTSPKPLTTIMTGAQAYHQQDLALAAMNIIKAPMTVEDPYSMPFEQLMQELLCSEASNKMMSRVLSCGSSKQSSMFNFSLDFKNAAVFDDLKFEVGAIESTGDPDTFLVSFSKTTSYTNFKNMLSEFDQVDKEKIPELIAETKTPYFKPQYHDQLMDSANRIGRFFNSKPFLSNEAEEEETRVIRLGSKNLVMAYAHCFKYTPSDDTMLGYLGKTSPFVLFQSKEPDSVDVWAILEDIGNQAYVPIGVLVSAAELITSDGDVTLPVTSIL
ncbi:hypothetical protein BJ741DRAFT_582250 [Chytriomyces cf. hyalinus JEL632]|nr:hypothetical protein BJ741DRAFT_582250 [Chytriomyces cf. hyalinus JEL632]